jgi:hypothetical protein
MTLGERTAGMLGTVPGSGTPRGTPRRGPIECSGAPRGTAIPRRSTRTGSETPVVNNEPRGMTEAEAACWPTTTPCVK